MRSFRSIFQELQRRRILAILALYGAGSFAILEVVDDLSGRFAWPPEVFNIALVLLLGGILNAAIASWFHGAARTQQYQKREILLHTVPMVLSGIAILLIVGQDTVEPVELDQGALRFAGFTCETASAPGQAIADSLGLDIAAMLNSSAAIRVANPETGNPATLLAGRIITGKGRTRISVELSDIVSGIQIWSAAFDRDSVLSADERLEIAAVVSSSVVHALNKHFKKE